VSNLQHGARRSVPSGRRNRQRQSAPRSSSCSIGAFAKSDNCGVASTNASQARTISGSPSRSWTSRYSRASPTVLGVQSLFHSGMVSTVSGKAVGNSRSPGRPRPIAPTGLDRQMRRSAPSVLGRSRHDPSVTPRLHASRQRCTPVPGITIAYHPTSDLCPLRPGLSPACNRACRRGDLNPHVLSDTSPSS
jgi:hypothetical protein